LPFMVSLQQWCQPMTSQKPDFSFFQELDQNFKTRFWVERPPLCLVPYQRRPRDSFQCWPSIPSLFSLLMINHLPAFRPLCPYEGTVTWNCYLAHFRAAEASEGAPALRPPGQRQDIAGQGGGQPMREHLLQHQRQLPDLQVGWGGREADAGAVRCGAVCGRTVGGLGGAVVRTRSWRT
jgi:hypothetical protein